MEDCIPAELSRSRGGRRKDGDTLHMADNSRLGPIDVPLPRAASSKSSDEFTPAVNAHITGCEEDARQRDRRPAVVNRRCSILTGTSSLLG